MLRKLADYFIHEVIGIRKSYSLNSLDLKMKKYLAKIPHGFFVEAGANNGISQSNTLYFEKYYGWKGLLIEAIPELADACRSNRPGALVENVALVRDQFEPQFVQMRFAGLMSVVKGGMKSRSEEDRHVKTAETIKNLKSYEISVPAKTLTDLLAKHDINKVDFLSLDIEGYELEALKGLDFAKIRPRYMLIEARYKPEIEQFMTKAGYREIDRLSEHDYLYEPE